MGQVQDPPSVERAAIRDPDHYRFTIVLFGDPKTSTKRKRTVSGDVSSGVHGLAISHSLPGITVSQAVIRGNSAPTGCGRDSYRGQSGKSQGCECESFKHFAFAEDNGQHSAEG